MSDKNLRNKLIRLAHQNPELRKDILPLLTEKVADKKDKNGLYPKDTIMVSKKGDEEIKIVGHKINQAIRAQQNKTQYDYVVQVLRGRRSGKEFKLTMNNMDSRYEPKFGKKASDDTPEEWFDAFIAWWGGIRKGLLADDENEVRNSLGWDLYQICVGWDQSSKERKSDAQKAIAKFSARFMKEIDALNKKADDIKK